MQFQEALDIILATATEYRVGGPNSNSVVFVALLLAGFSAPEPPVGVSAPGYLPPAR
jgi:hypothetical protein